MTIMISINLAFDEGLASELSGYLADLGIDSEQQESDVLVNRDDLDEEILKTFLKKTKRSEYILKKINSKSFLLSKKANVEDFGLGTCEICGYVAFEEELFSHRRTHGI